MQGVGNANLVKLAHYRISAGRNARPRPSEAHATGQYRALVHCVRRFIYLEANCVGQVAGLSSECEALAA